MPPAETSATTPAVEVDGTEATPRPIAPAGPVSIELPDLPPGEAALALLNGLKPDAPSLLAGRIEAIGRQLDDQVEEYRLNLKGTFPEFLAHAARKVKLKRALEARAGRPAIGSVAAEVLGLIRSVKRFRACEELKAERSRRIASARAELASVEANLRAEGAGVIAGNHFAHPDRAAEDRGENHQHDAILARFRAFLERRRALTDRLAKLDPQGDPRRGELVRQAIEAAGGHDATVAALTPTMPAASQAALDRLKADAAATSGELARVDDESRKAGDLRAALSAMQDKIPGLQFTIVQQREAAAGKLVEDAATGDLAAVRALLAAVGPKRPALAEALEAIRGGDDDLVAVVAELIGD